MANSKYEYVKSFEHHATLLPNTYLVVRIDGRGFHHLSTKHAFEKPNDRHALDLMNAAAVAVLREIPEICLAYGLSDEFSFVFDRSCELFDRRESKILTTVVSTFTAYYTYLWPSHFPPASSPLSPPPMPTFDGRAVQYPSFRNLRDYLSWRQVDCHINNLYNTTFWALVQKGGMGTMEAEELLKGTLAADKNEILFSRFGINYNNEPEQSRKGSVVYRDYGAITTKAPDKSIAGPQESEVAKTEGKREKEKKRRGKAEVTVQFTDIIRDEFWDARPWLFPDR
ncbi:MAG: hypothetical protein LQ338_003594 [Usnochroma carphineum]|nr:MAG: hypothetical protein LQ338_003594 [Usnochroma carphineum]